MYFVRGSSYGNAKNVYNKKTYCLKVLQVAPDDNAIFRYNDRNLYVYNLIIKGFTLKKKQ